MPIDQADRTTAALKRAEAQLASNDGNLIYRADAAMRTLDSIIEKPEQLSLKFKSAELSFDTPAPTLISPGPCAIVSMLDHIAAAYEQLGRWDKSCEVRRRAIEFADGWNKSHRTYAEQCVFDYFVNKQEFVNLYMNYSRALYKNALKEKSKRFSDMAISTLAELDGNPSLHKVYKNVYSRQYEDLAAVCSDRGDPLPAVDKLFQRSIDLQGEDASAVLVPTIAGSYQKRAAARLSRKNYAGAESDYKTAVNLVAKENNEDLLVDCSAALARCYWLQGLHDKAIETLQSAVGKWKRNGISRDFAKNLIELAYYLMHSGQPDEARKVLARLKSRESDLDFYAAQPNDHAATWAREVKMLRADEKAIVDSKDISIDKLETSSPEYQQQI